MHHQCSWSARTDGSADASIVAQRIGAAGVRPWQPTLDPHRDSVRRIAPYECRA